MGNKSWEEQILRLGAPQNFQKKYGKQNVEMKEMTRKWRGNDKATAIDPLIYWSWSTDLQSCKCSWGGIWEIWGALLIQMALNFLTRCTSFLQFGGAKDKTSWRQNRNIFTEINTWEIFRQILDKSLDKYLTNL